MNEDDWSNYKIQRNKVISLIRKAEAGYWKEKIEKVRNSGEFWKILKEMQGKIKKAQIGPILKDNLEVVMKKKGRTFQQIPFINWRTAKYRFEASLGL